MKKSDYVIVEEKSDCRTKSHLDGKVGLRESPTERQSQTYENNIAFNLSRLVTQITLVAPSNSYNASSS
jgi:hypothetical protein